MRKAMSEAEVGDDVYGEDPTVNRLQEMAAEVTGKEAGLFVSTGSMGNLIPIYLNCGQGQRAPHRVPRPQRPARAGRRDGRGGQPSHHDPAPTKGC